MTHGILWYPEWGHDLQLDPLGSTIDAEVETQLLRVDAGALLGIHGAVSSKA